MLKLISHESALAAIEAGVAKVRELSQPSCLAIVDAGGNLLAFLRVDDASLGTVEIAQNKAYTAAALRAPTENWMEIAQPGADLYGLERSTSRPFVLFAGGIPIIHDGVVIGGVGVSGGPADADIAIAQAMISAL
jgi:uncharacterized protein GlcG (DUF336 family)